MSQNCHNSGKICWNVLAESISYETSKRPGALPEHNDIIYCWSINETKAEHFNNNSYKQDIFISIIKISCLYKNNIINFVTILSVNNQNIHYNEAYFLHTPVHYSSTILLILLANP